MLCTKTKQIEAFSSKATLIGLPVGVKVTLTVTARNSAGESPASEAIEVEVP